MKHTTDKRIADVELAWSYALDWEMVREKQKFYYDLWAALLGKESADKAFGRHEADPYS